MAFSFGFNSGAVGAAFSLQLQWLQRSGKMQKNGQF